MRSSRLILKGKDKFTGQRFNSPNRNMKLDPSTSATSPHRLLDPSHIASSLKPTVSPGCLGTACHPPLLGTACHPPLLGTACQPPLLGTACHPPLLGTACHPPLLSTLRLPPLSVRGSQCLAPTHSQYHLSSLSHYASSTKLPRCPTLSSGESGERPVSGRSLYTHCLPIFHNRTSPVFYPVRKFSCSAKRTSVAKDPELPDTPGLNSITIKKFLRGKSLDYEESHPCLKISLPKYLLNRTLSAPVPPTDITAVAVYINKKTGGFVMPELGVSGTWSQLEDLLRTWHRNRNSRRGDPQLEYPVLERLQQTEVERAERLFGEYSPVAGLSSQEFRDLLKNLGLPKRDIECGDLARYEARVNSELTELFFPIRYTDGRLVGLRRLRLEEGRLVESNLPAQPRNKLLPFPHGLEEASAGGSRSCILVDSLLDSLLLTSRTGGSIPVVTLPDWTNLHPDHLPFLDNFQTIYLWLSNDVQSAQNARLFAQKIDEKRCRLVTSEFPSPSVCVRKKFDVGEIIKSAKPCYHEFLTTFENLRDNVYLEFLQSEELLGVKWKRFDQLNSTLGGFRRGELTVFSGRTGSGKTTFLSEYSLDLCSQGVNTLWCSFEVKNTRLLKMMLKQHSLINLDEHLEEFERVADKFSKLPLYLTDFHGSQQVSRVEEAMSHAVYVHDITHIIIDNMQFMLGTGVGFDKFQLQDNTIELFRRFATAHNCHVTLVIHPRKEFEEVLTANSIFGGAKATQEADNLLLLQEEVNPNSFFKKKYLQVAKNRYAGDLGVMPLVFTKSVLSFSKKIADGHKRQRRQAIVTGNKDGPISGERQSEPPITGVGSKAGPITGEGSKAGPITEQKSISGTNRIDPDTEVLFKTDD